MRLFHSGSDIIKEPDIFAGRKNADFGPGFYLSSDQEFAMRWVKCRKDSTAYVNVYEQGGEFSQIVIKSRKALEKLTWLSATEVDYDTASKYKEAIVKEKEEYQKAFGEILQ